jgi:hypothetical protein
MSIKPCPTCRHEVSSKATMCPSCGHPLRRRFSILRVIVAVVVICAAGIGMVAFSFNSELKKPKPEISEMVLKEGSGFFNGEIDFGYTVSFTVRNRGRSGFVRVIPTLSSSEGEWTRGQSILLEPEKPEKLTFFFHEPTINATNVRARIKTL